MSGLGDRLKAQAMNQIDAGNAALGSQGMIGDDTIIEIGDDTITLGELKKGYLRQADYTRKTQEIAEAKKRYEQYENELQQRRQFSENFNAFLAKRPDVLQAIEKFVETNGQDVGLPSEPDKKPEKEKGGIELPEELKQRLDYIDNISRELKDVRGELSKVKVDKAIERLIEETGIKSRSELNKIIERARDHYNPNKDYYGNLEDAYKIVQFEAEQEAKRLRKEKENAALFSGLDGEGNPKQKHPGELLLESLKKETAPLDLFK